MLQSVRKGIYFSWQDEWGPVGWKAVTKWSFLDVCTVMINSMWDVDKGRERKSIEYQDAASEVGGKFSQASSILVRD